MSDLKKFFNNFNHSFQKLDVFLSEILKEEKILSELILTQSGFIVHKYTLNYDNINLKSISNLKLELEKFKKNEVELQEIFHTILPDLKNTMAQFSSTEGQIKLDMNLLEKYLNETVHYSELLLARITQLFTLLNEGITLHKKLIPKEVEFFFASFESIANKIKIFLKLLEQISQKLNKFNFDLFFPEPRTYGRAMNKREYKQTIDDEQLSSSKDPTYVFDAPPHVVHMIKSMKKDARSNYFKSIGVEQASDVIFFETRLKPLNYDKPIRQSNGLIQYSFPKNLKIHILEAA
ncbi:MAG: hypothetical protein AB7V77_00795 [Candidatus Woesearchaeota archaeon]